MKIVSPKQEKPVAVVNFTDGAVFEVVIRDFNIPFGVYMRLHLPPDEMREGYVRVVNLADGKTYWIHDSSRVLPRVAVLTIEPLPVFSAKIES